MKEPCVFCHRTADIFTVQIPADDDSGQSYPRSVCGSCWEMIAAVANAALDLRVSRLEKQMTAQREAYPASSDTVSEPQKT